MDCDILIVGGGAGGVAAALSAAEAGASVCLIEVTDWLGGQLTTQGVCTPDEQSHIETFGGTRRYMAFRDAVRTHYRTNYKLSSKARDAAFLNPGSCWVSRISFEPRTGAELLRQMTLPFEESGGLQILFGACVSNCAMGSSDPNRIERVRVMTHDGTELWIRPQFVLDATDLGDVLQICGDEGSDWITGAESASDTGEPDAPDTARRNWVQPFTYPFAIDWSPATAHTNLIEPPEDYEELKACQNYHVKHGAITGLFCGAMPWWRYRRILAAENFEDDRVPTDLIMINTAGNDFYGGNVIGAKLDGTPISTEEAAQAHARARRASLGYLYWLQTECLRETADLAAAPGGGLDVSTAGQRGYPEFRLRRDVFDTEDGCSVRPYIRESRRIRSIKPVFEREIVVKDFSGNACRGDRARAAFMPDSVGIGHYALDIHPNGHGEPNHFVATRPFQIPLGALIPVRLTNYLPACKNAGVTHLTNGAYRLHPIEWNIGESAGLLAAFCLARGCSPREVYQDGELTTEFQERLIAEGIALHWYVDVTLTHSAFRAVQWLAGRGANLGLETDLLFRPDEQITIMDWEEWCAVSGRRAEEYSQQVRSDAAIQLYSALFPNSTSS